MPNIRPKYQAPRVGRRTSVEDLSGMAEVESLLVKRNKVGALMGLRPQGIGGAMPDSSMAASADTTATRKKRGGFGGLMSRLGIPFQR